MKTESKIFLILVIFFAIVAPAYAFITFKIDGTGHPEPIGTTVFILTFLATAMWWGFFTLTGRSYDLRYEDNKDGEIIDGAGALGFFPPKSIWPLWGALTVSVILMGPAFGWWVTILGVGMGIWAVSGWCYEYYVGEYRH